MNKTTSLVGAFGAFGALAYLMAPLPPEAPRARVVASVSTEVAPGTVPGAILVAHAASGNLSTTAALEPVPAQEPTVRLVRQLQTELLRLGCYDGTIDGHWSAETKEAMHVLGERVRVLRPVDTPDYIMLALARSQESHVCVPQGKATALHQPARLVPMTGLVPVAEPLAASSERARRTSPPVRAAEQAPTARKQSGLSRSFARRDVGIVTGPAERPSTEEARANSIPPADRDALEQSRMSLGAAAADTLPAGSDPRDPTAPTDLLGPSSAPRLAAAGDALEVFEVGAQAPVRDVSPASAGSRPSASSRSRKRAWTRTFFNEMHRNGP
jgi:hypothetical protein